MKKVISLFGATIAISLLYVLINSTAIFADTCTAIYGYGQNCVPSVNIAVNKLVQNPTTGNFVDNLGVNDPKFSGGQVVSFQLIVTNTGNDTIANVTVKDVFPQFISFVSGPGNFDNNSKTLTFEVTSLKVGESRTFTVQGKTAAENDLPKDQGVICVTNQAQVTANNGQSSSDNAQFCIQHQVLGAKNPVIIPASPVTQIPATGVNPLMLVGFLPAGFLGFILRKMALE